MSKTYTRLAGDNPRAFLSQAPPNLLDEHKELWPNQTNILTAEAPIQVALAIKSSKPSRLGLWLRADLQTNEPNGERPRFHMTKMVEATVRYPT